MSARMSNARATALICACALVANAIAIPAPAPPAKKCNRKETKMLQEKAPVVRRVPITFFYPFSLWPMPKYPPRDRDDNQDRYHDRGSQTNGNTRRNKR